MVVDRYYQQIFQSEKFHQSSPHGLTIDLQDNICVCCRTTKGRKRKQFSFFNVHNFFQLLNSKNIVNICISVLSIFIFSS